MTVSQGRLGAGQRFLDRFEVVACLGAGEMGETYQLRETQSGNSFSLKLFRPEVLSVADAWESFERGARRACELGVLAIAQQFEFGVDPTTHAPFVIGELLPRPSLQQLVATSGPLSVVSAEAILRATAPILDRAHAAGVFHLGIKPSNLFATQNTESSWQVRVSDFGLSELRRRVPPADGWIATPGWMPPEQSDAQSPPAATIDVYAMGLVIFYCLTGRSPFRTLTREPLNLQMLWAEMTSPLPAASARAHELGAQLSPTLDGWFGKALALSPAHRFESVGAMAQALYPLMGQSAQHVSAPPPAAPSPSRPPVPPLAPTAAKKTMLYGAELPTGPDAPFAPPPVAKPIAPSPGIRRPAPPPEPIAPPPPVPTAPAAPTPEPIEELELEPIVEPVIEPVAAVQPEPIPAPEPLPPLQPEPIPVPEPVAAVQREPLPSFAPIPDDQPEPIPAPEPSPEGQSEPISAPAEGIAPAAAAPEPEHIPQPVVEPVQAQPEAMPTARQPFITASGDEPIVIPVKKLGLFPALIVGIVVVVAGLAIGAGLLVRNHLQKLSATANSASALVASATSTPAIDSAPLPAPSAAAPAAPTTADVTFTCSPACDEIRCDDQPIASWQSPVQLAAGKHSCTATKKGYAAKTESFELTAGQALSKSFALSKAVAGGSTPAPAKTPAGKAPGSKNCSGVFITNCK